MVTTRQPELQGAVLDVDGQVDGRVSVVNERHQADGRRRRELDAQFQLPVVLRVPGHDEAQERVAVELRQPDLPLLLATATLIAPIASALSSHTHTRNQPIYKIYQNLS